MPSADSGLLPRHFSGGCLRRMQRSDVDAFQSYRNIPELGRFQGWSPMSGPEALGFLETMETTPLFQPGQWVQLAIADPCTGVLIGDIGLHWSSSITDGEVGFTLAPWAQGRGVACAAVQEAIQLLFEGTPVTRVIGTTDARNLPSVRLLQRLGFTCQDTREVVFRGEKCIEQVFVLPRVADGS